MASATEFDVVRLRLCIALEYQGIETTLPAVSGVSTYKWVMDEFDSILKLSVDGGPWISVANAGGFLAVAIGATLNASYNAGGPGAGRTILANWGAVLVNKSSIDANAALQTNVTAGTGAGFLTSGFMEMVPPFGIPAVSGAGTGRLYYDLATGFMVSENGGAYAALHANNLQGSYDGGPAIVQSALGAVTMANLLANNNHILDLNKTPAGANAGSCVNATMGALAFDPGILITHNGPVGAPTAGHSVGLRITGANTAGGLELSDSRNCAVGSAFSLRLRHNSNTNRFQGSFNSAAYVDIAGAFGVVGTLQQAYDGGGALGGGAGNTIATMTTLAVVMTNSGANNANVLSLSKTPGGAQTGDALSVTVGANSSGRGIFVTNAGATGAEAVVRIDHAPAAPTNRQALRVYQNAQSAVSCMEIADDGTGVAPGLYIVNSITASTRQNLLCSDVRGGSAAAVYNINTPTAHIYRTGSITNAGATVNNTGAGLYIQHSPAFGAGTYNDTSIGLQILMDPPVGFTTAGVRGQLITMGANTSVLGYAATFDWQGTAGITPGAMVNETVNYAGNLPAFTFHKIGYGTANTTATGTQYGIYIDFSTRLTHGGNTLRGVYVEMGASNSTASACYYATTGMVSGTAYSTILNATVSSIARGFSCSRISIVSGAATIGQARGAASVGQLGLFRNTPTSAAVGVLTLIGDLVRIEHAPILGAAAITDTTCGLAITMTPASAAAVTGMDVVMGPLTSAAGYATTTQWNSLAGCQATTYGAMNGEAVYVLTGNFTAHTFRKIQYVTDATHIPTFTGTQTGVAIDLRGTAGNLAVPGAQTVYGLDVNLPASTSVSTAALNVTTDQARGYGFNFVSTGARDVRGINMLLSAVAASDGGQTAIKALRNGVFIAAAVNTISADMARFEETVELNNAGGTLNLNNNIITARRGPTNTLGTFNTQGSLFFASYTPTGTIVEDVTNGVTGLTVNMTPVAAASHTVRGATITMGDYTIASSWGLRTAWNSALGCSGGALQSVVSVNTTITQALVYARVGCIAGATLTCTNGGAAAVTGLVVDLQSTTVPNNNAMNGVQILTAGTTRAANALEGALVIQSLATLARVVDIWSANTQGNAIMFTANANLAGALNLLSLNATGAPAANALVGIAMSLDGATIASAALSLTTVTAANRATAPMFLINSGVGAAAGEMRVFYNGGAPNDANGANGDEYHQTDGVAGTSIWKKAAGVWAAIC